MNEPTPQQVEAACLSFRHDYGIMTEKERYYLQCEAVYWLRAWQYAGVDPLAEVRGEDDKPLSGKWRVSSEGIFCGTLRIAKFDFDTDPSEQFKAEVFKQMEDSLNE